MATISDVSKLSGVSKATVSRVINGKIWVAAETQQKVLKAMEQLNYKPNSLAKNLAHRRSNALGVVVGGLSSPYYGCMLEGIESAAEAEGMHLIVADGHAQPRPGKKATEFLIERNCDALLICQEQIDDYDLRTWREQGHCIILIHRYVSELPELSVYLNNEAGGFLATSHLIEHGHRQILHLGGYDTAPDGRLRLEGYRRALEENGIAYQEELIREGSFTEDKGYEHTKQILKDGIPFTAIFAGNDQMAAGAMAAIYEADLKVPHDISIVGFDDLSLARYLYPALTTIRQPAIEMGRSGAQIAIRALQHKPSDSIQRHFQPQLVKRKSVAAP